MLSRTGSNHESNRVESWFKFGQKNLGRAGSNNESIAVKFWVTRGQIETTSVDRVGKSRIIDQTMSSGEVNEVES